MVIRRGRQLVAAMASAVAGVGFGLPCVWAIRYTAQNGQVWQFLGFPTYGDGPFEHVGIATTVPLLAGFLAVCVAEVVLSIAIAHRSPWAATASGALLPVEVAYWIGFALPLGFVLGALRHVVLRPAREVPGAARRRRIGTKTTITVCTRCAQNWTTWDNTGAHSTDGTDGGPRSQATRRTGDHQMDGWERS